MKFDRITLHVGHDKTGSTTIQDTLDNNRHRLLAGGILYPHGHWHARLGSYFQGIATNLAGDLPADGPPALRSDREDAEWMARLLNEFGTTPARHVVLSYEGFFTLPEWVLERIKAFALCHANEVRVIVYCRRPLDYATSAMSQRVRSGALPWDRYTGKLAALRAGEYAGDPDWRLGLPVVFYKHDLGKLARVFGKESIQLRKFGHHELIGGDVVVDFISAIGGSEGLARELANPVDRSNPSLSATAVAVGACILGKLDGSTAAKEAFRNDIVPILEKITGPKLRLNADEAWAIQAASRKESAYLAKEWGIAFAENAREEAEVEKPDESAVEAMAVAVMRQADRLRDPG